jgi:CDP-Glycerol:Poly(glycerophosphate) glycerophosphotransferase
MACDVIIVSARHMTHREAIAVGTELGRVGKHAVRYLDARLRLDDKLEKFRAAQSTGAVPLAAKLFGHLRTLLLASPFGRGVVLLRGVLSDRAKLRAIMAAERPRAVVIFDDRRVRPDLIVRGVAAEYGVSVVLVPFAASSVEADVYARRLKHACHVDVGPWRWLKRLLAKYWTEQVHQDATVGRLLFFEPIETITLAFTGLLSARPWVLGGSNTDIACAFNDDHQKYLIAGGVRAETIVVTGQPSLDAFAIAGASDGDLRSQLRDRYSLPADRPLVICCVPQHAEHHLVSWDRHREMTEELFSALVGSGASVLLSLHPKSRLENYADAAGRHGLPIVAEQLVEVLSAADLLVAAFSSTVAWAIGLGIPAIVVDALGSNYRLFRDVPGVTIVEDHAALGNVLGGFVRDDNIRAQLRRQAELGAARVGRLDGRASQRVVQAIELAITKRARAGAAMVQAVLPTRQEAIQ